ncbi:hypothetical protein L9F63_008935, partial [Diploptera punctata]
IYYNACSCMSFSLLQKLTAGTTIRSAVLSFSSPKTYCRDHDSIRVPPRFPLVLCFIPRKTYCRDHDSIRGPLDQMNLDSIRVFLEKLLPGSGFDPLSSTLSCALLLTYYDYTL